MFKQMDTYTETAQENNQLITESSPAGYLLINDVDEIIYANVQARHFLGLLSDEPLPKKQRFLPQVQTTYLCYPATAWNDWPARPSFSSPRYLIYSPPHSNVYTLLKVDILEQIQIDNKIVWAISINTVETKQTAVSHPVIC